MLKKEIKSYLNNCSSNSEINKLNSEAMLNIGKLDGITSNFAFLNLFHILISFKEARKSSEIEGIRTTYSDLINLYSNEGNSKTKLDEVYWCFAILDILYKNGVDIITKQTMFKIQSALRNFDCQHVRKNPFIIIVDHQNNTVYKPVETGQEILFELDRLEQFINIDHDYPLIKLSIFHYQFESIHPFDDGNGRTGRILNVLYLIMCGLITKPIFAMSDYIHTNKETYYKLFQEVNNNDTNISKFVIFMITAIKESSIKALNIIGLINDAYAKIINETKQINWLNNTKVISLMNFMVFDMNKFMDIIDISKPTAIKYLKLLIDKNLLIEIKSGNKTSYIWSNVYTIFDYLDD